MFRQPIEAGPGQRPPGDDDNSPAVLVRHLIVPFPPARAPTPWLGLGDPVNYAEAEPMPDK